jgi:hypothetical protein
VIQSTFEGLCCLGLDSRAQPTQLSRSTGLYANHRSWKHRGRQDHQAPTLSAAGSRLCVGMASTDEDRWRKGHQPHRARVDP